VLLCLHVSRLWTFIIDWSPGVLDIESIASEKCNRHARFQLAASSRPVRVCLRSYSAPMVISINFFFGSWLALDLVGDPKLTER